MRSVRFSVRTSVILPLVIVVFASITTFLTFTRVSNASNDSTSKLSFLNSPVLSAPDASPTPIYGGIIFGRGFFNSVGMFKINTDGTNRISLTDLGSIQAKAYSVSRDTGTIAFQAPSGDHGSKIFVINSDGSGLRQISPGTDPSDTTSDFNPSISPDGSKVAFSSTRRRGEPVATCADGTVLIRDYEIWVVNTDGTNFHQATFSEDHFVATGSVGDGSGCGMGSSTRAAWMADNQHLVVYGTRPYKPQSGDTRLIFPGSLEAWSPTGRFGTLYGVNPNSDPANRDETADDSRKQAVGAVGVSGSASGLGWLDVDPNNRVLFQAGCCFIPNADGLGFWTPGMLGVSYANRDAVMGKDTSTGSVGAFENVTYSPDGTHLAIIGWSPFVHNNQRSLFIDGYQNEVSGIFGFMQFNYGLAWAPGPPIPNPTSLVLQPSPLWLYNGVRSPVSPSLVDADGNVIARAAAWSNSDVYSNVGFHCDNTPDQISCSGTQLNGLSIDFTNAVLGSGSYAQGNLCEANGGVRTCVPYYNTPGSAFISAAATQPIALTDGVGGPGKFTISRVGTPLIQDAVIVNFTVGGTAVRDVDYTLDFSGNTIILPTGQASIDINVRPLRLQSVDRTVILTLQPNNALYTVVSPASATVTIKDDPTPTPTPTPSATPTPSPTPSITLSYITPNHGGDGGSVTATAFGTNIQPGAAVKLTRTGQPEILGTGATVSANGLSVTTTLDLSGKAQGLWDVVVTNPSGQIATLPGAFTIEASMGPDVWTDIVGRYVARSGFTERFYIVYGNNGNVDAPATHLRIVVPKPVTVTDVPLVDGSYPNIMSGPDDTTLEYYLSNVPAKSSSYAPILLTVTTDLGHQDFEVETSAVVKPDYQSLLPDIDPTLTTSFDNIQSSPGHITMTVNTTGDSGPQQFVHDATITEVDTPVDPTIVEEETGDNLTMTIDFTLPETEVPPSLAVPARSLVQGPNTTGNNLFFRIIDTVVGPIDHWNRQRRFASEMKRRDDLFINNLRREVLHCLLNKGVLTAEDAKSFLNVQDAAAMTKFFANPTIQKIAGYTPAGELVSKLGEFAPLLDGGFWPKVKKKMATNVTLGDPILSAHPELEQIYLAANQSGNADGDFAWLVTKVCAPCSFGACKPVSARRKKTRIKAIGAWDPNDKSGPEGVGDEHFVNGTDVVPYTISFENLATATAPAQKVVVTDLLDVTKLDLSTFSLGAFTFSNTVVSAPPGGVDYTADVDLRPDKELIVRINSTLDKTTGLLTVTFASLDPTTMQPVTDPLAGFLPPDVNSPEGQASVIFSVKPLTGIVDGAQLTNSARIVFDNNAPIDTATWLNTIDRSKPESHVNPLPAQASDASFPVTWSGTDTGSHVAGYTIYVSTNGGPFTEWLTDTPDTSGTYSGQAGTSYAFYSVARDGAGNIEDKAPTAEASTMTPAPTPTPTPTVTPTATPTATPTPCPMITLSPSALPGGTVGSAYDQFLSASGAVGSYTFAVTGGALPAGLTLETSGEIHGSPTASGTANFTITATNTSSGCSGSVPYSLTISPAPVYTCPLPQGYWKNHNKSWPVTSLVLGRQVYTQKELLSILNTSAGSDKKGDASITLAYQLIAAKLNIANGSDPRPAASAIANADTLLSSYSGKLPYGVQSSTLNGQSMVSLGRSLESYNLGTLTPACTKVSLNLWLTPMIEFFDMHIAELGFWEGRTSGSSNGG